MKPAEAKHSNSSDFKTHCLFALGSRDRSISIWLTNYSRPLTVIKDLFDNPIMDLIPTNNPLKSRFNLAKKYFDQKYFWFIFT